MGAVWGVRVFHSVKQRVLILWNPAVSYATVSGPPNGAWRTSGLLEGAVFKTLLGLQTCPRSSFPSRLPNRLTFQQMLEGWGTEYNPWTGVIDTTTTEWFCQALMMEIWGTCVGVDLSGVGSRRKKYVIGSSQTNWYGLTHQTETPNWMFLAQGVQMALIIYFAWREYEPKVALL